MTPQQLIDRAASQPEVKQERSIRIYGPALTDLLASGRAIRLTEVLSHPDQHDEVRRFRYGHLLGPGASREAIEEWQALHPSLRSHPELRSALAAEVVMR